MTILRWSIPGELPLYLFPTMASVRALVTGGSATHPVSVMMGPGVTSLHLSDDLGHRSRHYAFRCPGGAWDANRLLLRAAAVISTRLAAERAGRAGR